MADDQDRLPNNASSEPERASSPPLLESARRGLRLTYAGIIVTALLQLTYSTFAARLATPAEFGQFALAGIVLRLGSYLTQFGLSSAVVQRSQLTRKHIGAAIWSSVGASLLICAVVAAAAGPAAMALGDDSIANYIRVLSVDLFLVALGAVPLAILRRTLRFKAVTVVDILSFVVAYNVIGLLLLVNGFGTWALIAAPLLQTLIEAVLATALSRRHLYFGASLGEAKDLWAFGGLVSAISFGEFAGSSVDNIVVGRAIGASALGQYNRAIGAIVLPLQQVANGMSRVLMPAFSRAGRGKRSVAALEDSFVMSMFIILPVGGLVASNAAVLIPVLYGGQWDQAAGVLPIIAVASALNFLVVLPGIYLEASAYLKPKLGITYLTFALLIFFSITVWIIGPTLNRFAVAWALSELFRVVAYLSALKRIAGFRIGFVASPALWCAFATVLSAVATLAVLKLSSNLPQILQLMVGVLLYLVVYCTVVIWSAPRGLIEALRSRGYRRLVSQVPVMRRRSVEGQ